MQPSIHQWFTPFAPAVSATPSPLDPPPSYTLPITSRVVLPTLPAANLRKFLENPASGRLLFLVQSGYNTRVRGSLQYRESTLGRLRGFNVRRIESHMPEYSIVYVLVNPAMPGLVKIGRTSQQDTATRLAQLYTTGVPVPFELKFACRVQNPDEVEIALHTAFAPQRINPRREFFRIDSEQAIAVLRLLHTEDATAEIAAQSTGIDEQSLAAAEVLRSRRPNLNFHEMGIPDGSTLECPVSGTRVTVVGPKKVRLGDTELSLTAVTRQVLNLDHNVQPSPHWTYNGKLLREIYEETYVDSE